MQSMNAEIGRVVLSKAGRDQERHYIITKVIDKDFVLIADGNLRKLEKPKKKKLKHLLLLPDILQGIAEKIKQGKQVFDREVGSALRVYNND